MRNTIGTFLARRRFNLIDTTTLIVVASIDDWKIALAVFFVGLFISIVAERHFYDKAES